MSVEKTKTGWGTFSIYLVSAGTAVDEFPEDLRAALTEQELQVFLDPDSSMAGMIRRCEHPALRSWLKGLKQLGFLRLEAYWREEDEKSKPDVMFRFRHPDPEITGTWAIGLPRIDPVGNVHPLLVPIYSIIGSTSLGEPDEATYDLMRLPNSRFSNMGWIEKSPAIDPDQCYQLYVEPDGNVVGWHTSGQAVYCNHGKLSWMGPLEELIQNYFDPPT